MTQLSVAVCLLALASIISAATQRRLRKRIESLEAQIDILCESKLYVPSGPRPQNRTMWD